MLSIAATENVVAVAPAGMVTVEGTRTLLVLLLVRVTTKGAVVSLLRVTMPVAALAPAPSLNVLGLMLNVSVAPAAGGIGVGLGVAVGAGVGGILSVTVTCTVSAAKPEAMAVMSAVWLPSIAVLLMAVTAKDAAAAPAGIVTLVGTRTLRVLSLKRFTVKAVAVLVLRVTDPTAAFAPAVSLKTLGVMLKVKVGLGCGVGVATGVGAGVGVVSTLVTVTRVRPGIKPDTIAVMPTT